MKGWASFVPSSSFFQKTEQPSESGVNQQEDGASSTEQTSLDFLPAWAKTAVEKGTKAVQGAAENIQATAKEVAHDLRQSDITTTFDFKGPPPVYTVDTDTVFLAWEEPEIIFAGFLSESPYDADRVSAELRTRIKGIAGNLRRFADFAFPEPPETFKFSMSDELPTCMKYLSQDTKLTRLRFLVVPKKMKEEDFWRTYAYRVDEIICAMKRELRRGQLVETAPAFVASPKAMQQKRNPEEQIVSEGLEDDDLLIASLQDKLGVQPNVDADDYGGGNSGMADKDDDAVRAIRVPSKSPATPQPPTGRGMPSQTSVVAPAPAPDSSPPSLVNQLPADEAATSASGGEGQGIKKGEGKVDDADEDDLQELERQWLDAGEQQPANN